jgi:hypothetical protein
LDPLIQQSDTLDTKALEEEAKLPDTLRIRVFNQGQEFQGDMSIVPMILVNSCIRMACSTSDTKLIQSVLSQKNVIASIVKSAASFQSLDTAHAARYAIESLAILLCPTLPEFDSRAATIFQAAPKLSETLTGFVLKGITSDALWKESAASQNEVDRQSLVVCTCLLLA